MSAYSQDLDHYVKSREQLFFKPWNLWWSMPWGSWKI